MRQLTEKQLALIKLIDQQLTYDEMADRMGVSSRTIKANTERLRWIFGVSKTRHIPRLARDMGLLK